MKLVFVKNSDMTELKQRLEKEIEAVKQKYENQLSDLKELMAILKEASNASLGKEQENNKIIVKDLKNKLAE